MPTKFGNGVRTLFVSIVYAFVYAAAQSAASVFVAFDALGSGPEAFSERVTENMFLGTAAAIFAALVLYILLGMLRERPLMRELPLKAICGKEAAAAVLLAIGLRLIVCAYMQTADRIPALKNSLESFPDVSAAYSSPLRLIFGLLLTSVLAPVFEELLFRGLIQTELIRGFPASAAVILSSLIFALMHGNLFQGVFAFGVGLCLGYCFYITESLALPCVIHIVFNSSAMLMFLSYLNSTVIFAASVCVGIAAVFAGLKLLKQNLRS